MPETRATWVTQVSGRPVRSFGGFELVVVRGADQGTRAKIRQQRFRVGALTGNDLKLKDPAISGHHFEIAIDDEGLRLRDLDSKNGTFVGGVRVLDCYLAPGARIRAGATELELVTTDDTIEVPSAQADHFGPLVGKSLRMRELFAELERVAGNDSTVLITGETGTGKELVAEALVQASPRAKGPLVVVDCGALAPTLVESALFGHEKGAFTGATAGHAGVFERATGGTVFLDEIGELPLELQPKLLRALERREVQRLGGNAPIKVDVRVLAATHRELEAEVNRGRFRADLFYRLSVLRVRVPALRDRLDDIPLLARHFAEGLPHGKPELLDDAALARLAAHSWPGNVRELRNAVERLVLGSDPFGGGPTSGAAQAAASGTVDLEVPFLAQKDRLVESFERRYAEALLAYCGGNLSKGARKAGISRMAVVKMLSRHGLLAES